MRRNQFLAIVSLVALGLSSVGCGSTALPVAPPATPTATAKSNSTVVDNEVVLVNLKAADQLDGKEDHIIGKCYVCALGMDGKAEHSAEFQGYTAHLCSEGCCKHFKDQPEQVIAETKVPEAK